MATAGLQGRLSYRQSAPSTPGIPLVQEASVAAVWVRRLFHGETAVSLSPILRNGIMAGDILGTDIITPD